MAVSGRSGRPSAVERQWGEPTVKQQSPPHRPPFLTLQGSIAAEVEVISLQETKSPPESHYGPVGSPASAGETLFENYNMWSAFLRRW